MKKVAIIQARMNSTRLPGKVLRKINDITILEFQVNRIKKSELIDELIVATSTSKSDDVIVNFCLSNDITFFRGSEDDVLDRYYSCAKKYNADYNNGKGVDIKSPRATIEVETANTVQDAPGQLRGYKGPCYIAGASKDAVQKAMELTKGTTIGVMGNQGNIIKRSTRKK